MIKGLREGVLEGAASCTEYSALMENGKLTAASADLD